MRIGRILISTLALSVLALSVSAPSVATTALAQDAADDWEVIRQPETRTVFAYIPTSSGLTIGFRCVNGVYGAIIGGLPEAPRNMRSRILNIRIGDRARNGQWDITTDRTVAVADYPAPLARRLRTGGAVSILIPGGGGEGRNLRHNLTLPASSAAIDETLTACGRPLTDPRDALIPDLNENGLPSGLPSGGTWARAPQPSYPHNNYAEGFAVLTCMLTPVGGLERCEVESEFPVDGRFGRAALAGTRQARINSPSETRGQYAPRIIGFRVNFSMR